MIEKRAQQELRERAKRDHVLAYWDFRTARAGLTGGDGHTLEGFAAVFDTWAPIEDWEGVFNERIGARAFNRTIKDKADSIVSQFDHGQDARFGSLPIGKPAVMRAKSEGLWTETPLDESALRPDLEAAIRSGSVGGMSIQFRVLSETWDFDAEPVTRTIDQIELFEFGPVVFPAYPTTTVGLRSLRALGNPGVPPDARIYLAGSMDNPTRGTDHTAAATEAPTATTAEQESARADLARVQADLERQRKLVEAYG